MALTLLDHSILLSKNLKLHTIQIEFLDNPLFCLFLPAHFLNITLGILIILLFLLIATQFLNVSGFTIMTFMPLETYLYLF